MPAISAGEVKRLRDATNAPMKDCKAALEEANGDMQKALDLIRQRNAAVQAKTAGRETAEGKVAIFVAPDQSKAVIVEVRCESAPVAKNELFTKLVDDLAEHLGHVGTPGMTVEQVLAQPFHGNPKLTVNERIGEVVGLIRENMKLERFAILTGGPFGSYVHFDGSVGTLIQVEGASADADLLKDVCMHITAKQPIAMKPEEVDPKVIEREREIAKAQVAEMNKPDNVKAMIVENKIKTWLGENTLIEQAFVKDDSKKVGQLFQAAKLTPKKFVRFKVGEVSLA